MPVNANFRVALHPVLASTIAKYAKMDDELGAFYAHLSDYLKGGLAKKIFPSHVGQVESFLAGTSGHTRQLTEEPQVVAVTGRRALVAVNSFIFGKTSLLEDEAFFCGKALFVIGNRPDADQVSAKIHIYSKGKTTPHSDKQFDSLTAMNRYLAGELLDLECEREFDGLLVEIGIQCPEMGLVKIAAAPKVDPVIKELLDPNQTQSNPLQHHLCLVMHFFAPYATGIDSDMDRKAAEPELTYVCGLAARSQLLLLCEHPRGRRVELETRVQKYMCTEHSGRVCYYTQWQWDGLSTVQPELEAMLDTQLKKRSNQVTKKAIKELIVPFKMVHQIKRDINLSRSTANRQRRQPNEYQADFKALQRLAASSSDKLRKLVDAKIYQVSELVADHLRKGPVRNGIIQTILSRAAELKDSTEHKVEIVFLEVVAKDIRDWNADTQVLDKADQLVLKTWQQLMQEISNKAIDIPEIVLVPNDMFSTTEHSSLSSRDSETRASIGSFEEDMVQKRLRAGRLENFAAGIAAPLWVPLAAITMAIIAPVIGAQKGPQSDEKFKSEIRGAAQDFLDRLDSGLIRTQFFARVKERFENDARKLKSFVELYCIMPADRKFQVNAGHTDDSLMQHLADLEGKLQFLRSNLIMMQVEKLGYEVLSKEECRQYGIDTDIAELRQLGKTLMSGKPVYLVSPPESAQKPLVLKLAATRETSYRLLLEIDILKTVSAERHNNIVQWLGTVYFPRHQVVGFLTYQSDCNLWEFLHRFRSQAVPYEHQPGSVGRRTAFVVCRNTCDQIFAAVHLLHSKQILHRDLKPENVLVDIQQSTEPLRIVAKLCDFGLAKHESELSGQTYGGTNGYMAPELLQQKPLFSNKSDIYALGVIAWECFFGLRSMEYPGAMKSLQTVDNKLWDQMVESMTNEAPAERLIIEQCRVLLRQLDVKDSSSALDPKRLSITMPSLKDCMQSLGSTFTDGKSFLASYK